MSPSSVNFNIKSFQDSTLYVNTKTLNMEHQIGSGASNIDVEDIQGDVADQSLLEEFESCKHFLTDTEMGNGRQSSTLPCHPSTCLC